MQKETGDVWQRHEYFWDYRESNTGLLGHNEVF